MDHASIDRPAASEAPSPRAAIGGTTGPVAAWARRFVRCAIISLVIANIAIVVLGVGLGMRQALWETTYRMRFTEDISNAYRWGSASLKAGYLELYGVEKPNAVSGVIHQLDYPPLRLLVISRWVAWTKEKFPDATGWREDYAFNAPLLRLNTALSLAAAIAAGLLVGLWVRRSQGRPPSTPRWAELLPVTSTPAINKARGLVRQFRPGLAGLLAGSLLWLNIAVAWDSHAWPQWDCWVMPFYLLAPGLAPWRSKRMPSRIDESSPPLRHEPTATSLRSRKRTASTSSSSM